MVKKLKQKVKAKSGRATATAKQKVIINVGGKGGSGRTRQRAPVKQIQPQYIQQPTQAPSQYDFNQFKNDIMENVGKKVSDYVGNRASEVLNINPIPPAMSSTSTNYDVASLLTAGTGAVKTAYDIYKDYKSEQKETAPSGLPIAQPAPLRRPISQIAPAREQKEREVKENPTNYLVPSVVPSIPRRPERRALPTPAPAPVAPPAPAQPSGLPSGLPNQTSSVLSRKKTPAELSTEQMLADRDRRNKMTQEAKEAGKPVIPFMNIEEKKEVYKPPQIARRPERQALPTRIEPLETMSPKLLLKTPSLIEPQFSVGEEPKEIIRAGQKPVVMPPSFLKRNLPERIEKRQEQRDYKHAEEVNQQMEKISNEEFVKRGMVDIARMKEQLKVADILQQPVKPNPSISNEQFIENARKEILEAKKEREKTQPLPASMPEYLKFIQETKEAEKQQTVEKLPAKFPLKQRKPVGRTNVLPEKNKESNKDFIERVNKEIKEEKAQTPKPPTPSGLPNQTSSVLPPSPAQPKPLGERGQGTKPKAGQTEDKKIKAQKAKEAYVKATPEQKEQKQIKQQELRARKKQAKLEAKNKK